MWREADLDPALPDISGVEYLLEMLMGDGLGWCSFDPMGGVEPLPWSEIDSFSRVTGLALEPWEARQLRSMSAAYVEGRHYGQKPMKVSPCYADRPEEDPGVALERQRISEGLKTALSGLAAKTTR